MERLTKRIIQCRWVILGVVLGLTLFFGYQIRNISINSDILSTLPDDDPTGHLYKSIGNRYGGNDIGMIVLETDDVFQTQVLQHIKQITDSLKISSGVSTVTSLTNILDIKSSDWGIEIGNLVDEYDLPDEQAELDSLRSYVFSRDMYKGVIVSEDGTATVILFTLLQGVDRQEIASDIQQKIKKIDLSETVYYGGLPFMLNDITDMLLSDMLWLIPIVFIIIALILVFSFRSFRGMILPLLTAGITVIWTLGTMALAGFEITIITNFIPVVLLSIGSAYTIHVLNSINLNMGNNSTEVILKAMVFTTMPIILAAVTTAIGFVSFVFGAYLTMIKEFGICSAIGILIALLLSIFFVPAYISAFSTSGGKRNAGKNQKNTLLSRIILQPIVKLLLNHPSYIIAAWAIVLVISVTGIFYIRTSVNITEYFKKDNPTRVAEGVMQEKFGGSLPVFIEFQGDIQDPDVLKMMIRTQDFMKTDPNISSAQSVADLVEQMNDAMGEGKRIPDERAKVEQLWFLLDGQDVMDQLVSGDLDRGIIQSKFASIETREIAEFTNKMNRFIEENSSDALRINFTGIPPLYVKLNDSLVKSQYSSLIIAIIMVLLFIGFIMRSFSNGVYATIPIIATILLLLGFMGFSGIALDIATVLVGSIALGIGIDYSIHVITGFNTHVNGLRDAEKAIEETILTKGRAVIINVASVAAGFLVLMFAQILPIRNFGLLIAISMVGSGLGALTLLPVLLILAHRRKKIQKTIKTQSSMKSNIQITGFILMVLAGSVFSARAQDAGSILKNMDRVLYAPKDMTGTNRIILIDRNGKQEVREANIMQKGTEKRIIRFTSPASQAGIAVLGLPDDVMYMYLPAFGKERRISASVKNQNFAGTDFSYDDMEPKPYSDKYTPKLIMEEGNSYVLELIPKGRSDYSKIVAHIDRTNFYPEYMEYYDRGNAKIKEATYTFEKVGEYWNAKEIEMKNLKRDHITKMQTSDVKYDSGLSDDEFTIRKLKQ
jgi:predicted RND superfamily exporter protein/outer membrane lipoprotein-sorting protein